jgi:hypothetical protein
MPTNSQQIANIDNDDCQQMPTNANIWPTLAVEFEDDNNMMPTLDMQTMPTNGMNYLPKDELPTIEPMKEYLTAGLYEFDISSSTPMQKKGELDAIAKMLKSQRTLIAKEEKSGQPRPERIAKLKMNIEKMLARRDQLNGKGGFDEQ